jgi:hypothetical protein
VLRRCYSVGSGFWASRVAGLELLSALRAVLGAASGWHVAQAGLGLEKLRGFRWRGGVGWARLFVYFGVSWF